MTEVDSTEQTVFMPRSIGPYRIESELGSGAMGTVFYAVHSGLDRPVALKVLRPDTLQDPDSIRRFLREARSIARLEHPNIVSVYDAGEADGVHYIAMKLLAGETLEKLLARSGPLPIEQAIKIGIQLANALDYAHSRDVVHLDVKPANVMVSGNDQVALTDFSIAQALNPGATRSSTIAGTPLYMSPEQITGQNIDSRSDIYSLGLLLYEMCVGHPPFTGQMVTVMYAHLHTEVPDIREALPNIPPQLASVIHRSIAKDPNDRFQTANEMARSLREHAPHDALEGVDTVVFDPSDTEFRAAIAAGRPEGAVTVVEEPSRTKWIYAGGAAVLVACVAVVAAFFGLRGHTTTTGTLTVASVPAGATFTLDNAPEGRTPATLRDITQGSHVLEFSKATYNKQDLTISVHGGATTSIHAALSSWPISRLIHVNQAILTTHYTIKGQAVVPGPELTQISERRTYNQPVYLIAELVVQPAAQHVRNIQGSLTCKLMDPGGVERSSSQPVEITLKQSGVPSVDECGVRLHVVKGAPTGTYRYEILVDDQLLHATPFTVTR